MYFEQFFLDQPSDSSKIWRYLDFTKFVSLLDTGCLFFCRTDKLPDPFEGSTPKANIKKRIDFTKKKELSPDFADEISNTLRIFRNQFYVNCWHINDFESAAMWSLFLTNNEGIAIQSTLSRFKNSFDKAPDNVSVGAVKYIDYESDLIPEIDIFQPFLHKRKSYEYEKELRAITLKVSDDEEGIPTLGGDIPEMGTYVPVDLDMLIDKIYVSPTAPDWFFELTESIVEKYNLNKGVYQSNLKEDPVY